MSSHDANPGSRGIPRDVDACLVLYRPDLDLLEKTLRCLSTQARLRMVRVHVNDGDTRELRSVLERHAENVSTLVTSSSNIGFAGGQNKLLSDAFEAGARFGLVLNPDLELKPGAIEEMVAGVERAGGLSISSGTLSLGSRTADGPTAKLIDTTGITWTSESRHLDRGHGDRAPRTDNGSIEQVPGLSGACMLVPQTAWDRIVSYCGEFFDEDFFAYREDAELGIRAMVCGVRSTVLHLEVGQHFRGSPGTSRTNATTNKLSVRNRFLIASKWGVAGRPGSLHASLVRDALVIAAVLLREPRSRSGLWEAARLRRRMREKRAELRNRLTTHAAPPTPTGLRDSDSSTCLWVAEHLTAQDWATFTESSTGTRQHLVVSMPWEGEPRLEGTEHVTWHAGWGMAAAVNEGLKQAERRGQTVSAIRVAPPRADGSEGSTGSG